MGDSSPPKEKLAAVLAADAVGFSRLMHDDERTTVATLDEYRGVYRRAIDAQGGRIVDMAGDSILAVFESATAAVNSAIGAQRELASRNDALPSQRQMWFRVGINLGDILVKEDGTVYGDGVNVAARLQSMAEPGGINIAGSVFDSVRAKIAGPFNFLGDHVLKNIATPVPVYSVGDTRATAPTHEPAPRPTTAAATRPTVEVLLFKVISGGSEVAELAAGLHEDILGSLVRQTAIDVRASHDGAMEPTRPADFQLEGSIRAVGDRLRLSFSLLDTAAGRQIWSERYDRQFEEIFDLEDEISRNVASAVRLRIKAGVFEKLRNTHNEALSVPELLSKAAGFLVNSYSHNDEIAEILQLALTRMPDNSMANAMMVFCRYRRFEFSPRAIPDEVKQQLIAQSQRALQLDGSSYFAHLIVAIVQRGIVGNFAAALVHAETARNLNPGFSQATALAGIAKIHLGEPVAGIALLKQGIDTAPEDPHRFRHLRELAIGYFILGDVDRAAATIDQLFHLAPDLLRNELVAAPILMYAQRHDESQQRIAQLIEKHPDLNQRNMRQTPVKDAAADARLREGLTAAGLPP